MNDLISRAVLAGLGMAHMTKDVIQKTAEDLVNQSHLSEEEGRKLVKDWERRSAHAQKALEKKVETAVHKAFRSLNPTMINKWLKVAEPKTKRPAKSRPRRAAKKAPSR
jgi:polyhydroxyalkanoate synthesis regulator phasin